MLIRRSFEPKADWENFAVDPGLRRDDGYAATSAFLYATGSLVLGSIASAPSS